MKQPYRLGSLLLQKKLISQDQLDTALRHQREQGLHLGEALIDLGFINEKQIKRALNRQSRVRFYAAVVTFCMAPVSWCQASQNDELEHLPEYTFTQVADQLGSHGLDSDLGDFSIDSNESGIDLLGVTTSAAWYLYKGGLANNQMNDVPVKMKLSANTGNGYKVQFSIDF